MLRSNSILMPIFGPCRGILGELIFWIDTIMRGEGRECFLDEDEYL